MFPGTLSPLPLQQVAAALLCALALTFSGVDARADGRGDDTPKSRSGETAAGAPASIDEYHFEPGEICPFCALTPGYPNIRRGLHWHQHWRRVGLMEYISTPLLLATAGAIEFGVPATQHARWSSPILFDKAARSALVFHTRTGRKRSRIASDALFYASIAQPVLVDNFLVTWIGRQSPEVAWQIFVINAQAYSLTLALNTALKRITARQRPWGDRCPDATGEYDCASPERYRSFYSGHAAVTATGAGLMCAHHTQLELYKNPAADTAACLSAVAFTAATSVLRMTSDNHWASDVLVGDLMGYLSGYLLPTLLYYREFRITPRSTPEPGKRPKRGPILAVLPMARPGSFQLSAFGVF